MNKVVQTEVDEEAINEIDNEIASLVDVIEDTNRSINFLREKKNRLQVVYFCGKKIRYEHGEEYPNERLYYELSVQVSDSCSIKIRAYTNAHDMKTFVAHIEGYCEESNIQFKIETFDEAKQICRQWLADLIYKKFQEDDNK